MSPNSKFRVVVCGAGIGGLTAAVALSEYPDIDVEVYECAAELAEVGAGLGIFPRPWEILRRLGLIDDLLKYTAMREGAAPSLRYRKSDQDLGMEFYRLATSANTFTFHRADFQQSLLRRLPASCRTHCSKRLRSYSQRPTGAIDVLFEDGSTTICDVLVGADGLKSAVRRSFIKEKVGWARSQGRRTEMAGFHASVDPVWSGIVAYRALIPAERLRSRAPNHPIFSTPTQHNYLGKNGFVIAYPISLGQFINFAAFTSRPDLEDTIFDGPWVSTADKEEFSNMFSTWEPEVRALISCVEKPLRWAIHTVKPMKSFVSGRVVLIGDAAHAMHPFLGSGAGQSVEDAYILATLLGHHTTTRQNLHRALHVYDEICRPRALEVAAKSRMNGRRVMLHHHDFRGMSQDAVLKGLRSLAEEIARASDWTWNTPIDGLLQEALTMLLRNAVL